MTLLPWSWLHRRGLWRGINATMHSHHGWTRARYCSRLPLPSRLVRALAQRDADRKDRRVFVRTVRCEPRTAGLRTWEIAYATATSVHVTFNAPRDEEISALLRRMVRRAE